MSNPAFDMLMGGMGRQPQPQQNGQNNGLLSIMSMMNQVRSSPNPGAAMQQLAASNPAVQNVMNYIQSNGGSARNAFYNAAAQQGVDPNQIIQQLQNLS